MATSLSNLVDNLTEGIHKIKCKDCDCFLEYQSENSKDNSIKHKFLSCNKGYSNKIDEEVKKKFKNTFKFSNNDINKFVLLLRKGVYPSKFMDEWEKFNEISLPEKAEFYSNLNMEDITDANYMHSRRVCKDFVMKGQYHELYLENDTLPLADIFENSRNICLKIYHQDPAKFFFSSKISMASIFEKD